jgi:hypothetical protein
MTITPSASPQAAVLETQLVELRKEHASIGFGGDILAICVGVPAMIIGSIVFSTARKGEDLFWGGFLFVDGVILTLIGGIGIPVKAGKKGRLTRQINETEAQLRALNQRVTLFPPALERPLGLAFALSSPVIRF